MQETKTKIAELADSIAGQHAISVIDVELAGSRGKSVIRVFIDKENGVTLNDCEKFSRELSVHLDIENLIPNPYILEVSSPGLDRPLKGLKDFERSLGKLVKIITKERIDGQNILIGNIMEVKGNNIKLSNDNDGIWVSFEQISKARLEIEIR